MDDTRDKKLIDFIKEMTDPELDLDQKEILNKYIQYLKEIYLYPDEDNMYRHSYARIATEMYDHNWDAEKSTLCKSNIQKIISEIQDDNLKKVLGKLCDHIELESIHLGRLQSIKESEMGISRVIKDYELADNQSKVLRESLNKVESDISSSRENIGEIETRVQEVSEEIKDHHAQSISILSIFSAVVFAFSGGFSLMGNAFSNLYQISKEQSMFFVSVICIIGIILYDVIYLLLNEVGKYAGSERPRLKRMTKNLNIGCIVAAILLMGIYWLIPQKEIQADQKTKIESVTVEKMENHFDVLPTILMSPSEANESE